MEREAEMNARYEAEMNARYEAEMNAKHRKELCKEIGCRMQWQPIELAPKNGCSVDGRMLLRWEGEHFEFIAFGWWEEERYAKKPHPHWAGHPLGVRESKANQPTHFLIIKGPYSQEESEQ